MFGWAGLLISVIAAVIAYVTYTRRHRQKSLSYIVLRQDRLGPRSNYFPLEVFYAGKPVADPVISVTRILNSGEEPLSADDFEIPISIDVGSTSSVRAAVVVSRRPPDLAPQLQIRPDGRVHIDALLLNSGDMFEVQLLTSGVPEQINLRGRVRGLTTMDRVRQLPYPPGSGSEGEMLPFDKLMWFIFTPIAIVGVVSLITAAFSTAFGASPILTSATAVVAAVVSVAAYLLHLRRLVRKRRIWRP